MLGIGSPFAVAAGTYSLFHFLDGKISGAAREVISRWIGADPYEPQQLRKGLIEIFDRIYGFPLFSLNSIIRCSLISLGITTALIIITANYRYLWFIIALRDDPVILSVGIDWVGNMISNIVGDYISLFAIRRWFVAGPQRPMALLLIGLLFGLAIYTVFYVLRDIALGIFFFHQELRVEFAWPVLTHTIWRDLSQPPGFTTNYIEHSSFPE